MGDKHRQAIGLYVLVMQNDGNLVIYNNALARNDYEGGLLFGALVLDTCPTASGASFYQVDGGNQFTPSNAFGGRAGALGYELVGSQPSSGQVGHRTAQKQFSHTYPELGARTITVTFTIRANNLPETHYSGEARAWNEYTAVALICTGFFRLTRSLRPRSL